MGVKHTDSKVITFASLGISNILDIDPSEPYENINNYISVNDFVANFYEQIGNTYYYYPDSLKDDDIQQTHSNFISRQDILDESENNYIKNFINWKPRNAYSIIKYDYNYIKNPNTKNNIIKAFPNYIAATEDDLRDSIDLLNRAFFIKTEKLHYLTSDYSYVIGTILDDKNTNELIGVFDRKNIIWGNGGRDWIKGSNS